METMSDGKALRIGQPNKPTGIIQDWKKIRRLTQRHTPSTAASIPSKYQTFFYPTTEKKGFKSQAPRFTDHQDADCCPGPGTYSAQEGFQKADISFSKRGIGGLASKAKRFPCGRQALPGPGRYDPTPTMDHQDFNRAGVSSNFHNPLVLQRTAIHSSPAPNSYNILSENVRDRPAPAHSVFKSTTKRSMEHPSSAYPAPGQYSVDDCVLHQRISGHVAVFRSKTNRSLLHKNEDIPGPGAYAPHSTGTTPRSLPYFRRKHYLCLSAPAMPLPPLPPPPGPGHYETQGPAVSEKRLVSGAVFLSTASRWMGPASEEMPGPGHYDPKAPGRRSYLCTSGQRWN